MLPEEADMTDFDDFFESEAERLRREAEADEADLSIQARRARKRADEIAKEIRMGIRDANGDLIELAEVEDDDENEDEEPEIEDEPDRAK